MLFWYTQSQIGKPNIFLALTQLFHFFSRWFDPTMARTPDQSLWGRAHQALSYLKISNINKLI